MISTIERFIGWVDAVSPIVLAVALLIWLALSGALIVGRVLHDRYQRVFRVVEGRRGGSDVQRILSALPARVVARAAADPATAPTTATVLARHFIARSGTRRLVRIAQHSHSQRGDMRRVAALRLLARAGYPALMPLLQQALHSQREDVVDAVVSLLGTLADPDAAALLTGALRERLYQPSRVATELDHFHVPVPDLVLPLLAAADAGLRYWGAALAARYLDVGDTAAQVLHLTADAEPRVRKAAIQSLRYFPDAGVAPAAVRLTGDPVFYVRVHAARTLAACRDVALAGHIVRLLGDADWWVRLAARESLASFGLPIVPAVLPLLDSTDPFVAEGVAEVLHNVGYVDEMLNKALACRVDVAVACFRPLLAAGGEILVSNALARHASARSPALLRLEPALRAAAQHA